MMTLSTRPLRILVVDDDPAMVGAITALVGTEGHQVITAYDGLTAVKRFREESPDIVLLDLAMPGPDGFTVAGQIRASGLRADPRRVGRERRGGEGQGARHRRRRLPRQAVRQGGAARPDRGRHAAGRSRGRRGDVRSALGRRAATSSRPATRRGSATSRWSSRRRSSGCSRRSSGRPATSSRTTCSRGPAGRPRRIRICSGSSRISPASGPRSRAPAGRGSWRSAASATGSTPMATWRR